MKKYLSIVLAIVMMFAICVPAFAADDYEINQDNNNTTYAEGANVDVYTTYDDVENEYTVTIPADLAIEWGDPNAEEIAYSVYTNFIDDATLSVVAARDNDGKMTATEVSVSEFLTFQLTANGAGTFTGYNVPGTTPAAQAAVKVADWEAAPFGEYHGSVIFTVTYTPAD